MYLLKLSFRPWRSAFWSQLFTALTMGFLLCLAGVLSWFEAGLAPIVDRLNGEQVITAYLSPEVSMKDEAAIADAVRVSLGAQAESADLRVVGQEKFVDQVRRDYPELAVELENLGNEMSALVPTYISVAGTFDENTVSKIRKIPGVESAESSQDRFGHIAAAFSALRWVARILIAGLMLAILTGLLHLARINSHVFQDAFRILKLWGAGQMMARLPALISGLTVGLLGGVLASIGWLVAARGISTQVQAISPLFIEIPAPEAHLAFLLAAVGAGFGLLTSLFTRVAHAGK